MLADEGGDTSPVEFSRRGTTRSNELASLGPGALASMGLTEGLEMFTGWLSHDRVGGAEENGTK